MFTLRGISITAINAHTDFAAPRHGRMMEESLGSRGRGRGKRVKDAIGTLNAIVALQFDMRANPTNGFTTGNVHRSNQISVVCSQLDEFSRFPSIPKGDSWMVEGANESSRLRSTKWSTITAE